MSEKKRIAILGAGDLGRQIANLAVQVPGVRVIGFYDDWIHEGDADHRGLFGETGTGLLGPLESGRLSSVLEDARNDRFDEVVVAVGYRHFSFRRQLRRTMVDRGVPLATLVHPHSFVDPSASVAEGCVLGAGSLIGLGVRIDANCFFNMACVVEHDSVVGSDTMLGPGCVISGNCSIGRRCFLGSGTVLSDGIHIGDDVSTGCGTVVIEGIESGDRHVGVPSRSIRSADDPR